MKKVLLLSLSLVLVLDAFAQQRVAKNDIVPLKVSMNKTVVGNEADRTTASTYVPQTAKSVVINRWDDIEDGEVIETTYDLQSNSWCSNRMYQLPSGEPNRYRPWYRLQLLRWQRLGRDAGRTPRALQDRLAHHLPIWRKR